MDPAPPAARQQGQSRDRLLRADRDLRLAAAGGRGGHAASYLILPGSRKPPTTALSYSHNGVIYEVRSFNPSIPPCARTGRSTAARAFALQSRHARAPAQAGAQSYRTLRLDPWAPAFAGARGGVTRDIPADAPPDRRRIHVVYP